MFNSKDVKLMSSCINNYIELANTQKSALTVGSNANPVLVDFYEQQVNDCFILQKKVNALLIQTLKV